MFNFAGFLKGLSLQDVTDRSKQLIIQISPSATAGTSTTLTAAQTANRTITLPDGNATLSTADSIETLTNKTIGGELTFDQTTTPGVNPPSGENDLYFKADQHLYSLDSTGTERQIDAAFLNPMTTKGDMIVGGVAGVETRLPGGTNGQFLTYNTGAPDNIQWSTFSVANNIVTSLSITGTTNSNTYSTPTNGTVTITPTGRSVMICLTPNTSGLPSQISVGATLPSSAAFVSGLFQILKDGVSIGSLQLAADFPTAGSSNTVLFSPNSIFFIDPSPTATSHTYAVQYQANTANTTVGISNCLLVAKEF